MVLGVGLGVASSRTVWRTVLGHGAPAEVIRKLLAIPRSIHELLWGLLLLQLVGLEPVVAVVAIAIPFGALVARVLSDLIDALPTGNLNALRTAGAPPGVALLTALGPPLLPQLLSYSSYRLECALRSATLLGVFGLGGLGTELRLTLQSLNFKELWSGLWLLLAAMVLLESLLGWLRHRWSMPTRFTPKAMASGRQGRELLAVGAALIPLLVFVAQTQQVDPAALLHWQALPPMGPPHWAEIAGLHWPSLVANTLVLTGLAAALAVGGAPLMLLLVAALLIWNTIRTAMFARRREIEVMKLVGATNWFIRLPFMLEGLLQSLVGEQPIRCQAVKLEGCFAAQSRGFDERACAIPEQFPDRGHIGQQTQVGEPEAGHFGQCGLTRPTGQVVDISAGEAQDGLTPVIMTL
jgi:phosphonate transport system permease protein